MLNVKQEAAVNTGINFYTFWLDLDREWNPEFAMSVADAGGEKSYS